MATVIRIVIRTAGQHVVYEVHGADLGVNVGHVEVVGAVDAAAPPTQADLDAIADSLTAENCGVRPVVRVLEDATLPAHEDTGEATCEELHEGGWWPYVRRWAE